jgi:LAS superfamily LD-carboxypeptidase LdcB
MLPGTGFGQLTGEHCEHLCRVPCGDDNFQLTPLTAQAFLSLAAAAREAGIELAIASAHRNLQRQLSIWNAKACGQRPVLDQSGVALDVATLSERELVFAILRWSALPGTSRHHWGTDLDVYDAAATAIDYKVQLTPAETCEGGVFARLHAWLDERIAQGAACGFYRPYAVDLGGVAPEPWHLSYAPEALLFEQLVSPEPYYAWLAQQPLALRHVVLAHFEEIYARFIAPVRDAQGYKGTS